MKNCKVDKLIPRVSFVDLKFVGLKTLNIVMPAKSQIFTITAIKFVRINS